MGGFDTEITPQTKIVFLEGANFNEKSVRLTSKRQGLRTEASARFEKGIDSNLAKVAVDRVCQLSEKISCAKVVDSAFDEGQKDKKEKKIKLRLSKTNKLIGEDLSLEEISKILNRLEIETELFDEYLIAKVPSFRLDIEIEEDLIEEVATIISILLSEPISQKIGIKKCVSLGLFLVGISAFLPILSRTYKSIFISRLML